MNKINDILPDSKWTPLHAAHLLRRASFSGTDFEINECYHLGLKASVKSILRGVQPGHKSMPFKKRINPKVLQELPKLPYEKHDSKRQLRRYNDSERRLFTMQAEWLQRMLSDSGPLEKITLFWHGMLTSSYAKVRSSGLMLRQNQLFRNTAFGDYRSLVKSLLLDPAMIYYLDIDKNTRRKPNENFARELLELFTLGEGNYSPKLIKKISKQIVGLKMKRKPDVLPYKEKDIEGLEKRSGYSDKRRRLSALIDSIFDLPVCGELLVRKLWKFYVSKDNVDEHVVKYLAYELRKSRWDISTVVERIFTSKLFYDESVIGKLGFNK